jgi:hypothetical protein
MTAADDSSMRLDSLHLATVTATQRGGGTVKLDSLAETVSTGAPVRDTLTMRGLAIPAQSLRLKQNPLVMMGIDTLTLDFDEALVFDAASNTATIQQAKLTARGRSVSMPATVRVPRPRGEASADAMLTAMTQVAVGSLQVTFTNDTLVQRLIAMQASQSGKTTADVIGMAKLGASFFGAALVPDQPDAGEQIAAFIDNPKTLTITATPPVPVPLGGFEGASLPAAQKAMNLHLTAD